MHVRYYAGIGSRETPKNIGQLMVKMGTLLADSGFILRSGGAEGADTFFEQGCDLVKGKKEIFLPWYNFNDNKSGLFKPTPESYEMARKYHPVYDKLTQGMQKMMARNCHQVLGLSLNDPVEFIVCWTENGKGKGGTGQAVRIAKDHGIPVYDLKNLTIESEDTILSLLKKRIQ